MPGPVKKFGKANRVAFNSFHYRFADQVEGFRYGHKSGFKLDRNYTSEKYKKLLAGASNRGMFIYHKGEAPTVSAGVCLFI